MTKLGKRLANLRCKLFQFEESGQWKSVGLGIAHLKNLEDKWLAVFEGEDGSELGWVLHPENEFTHSEPKVIRLFCSKSRQDHALSFQFEEGADRFWQEIQNRLAIISRPPE